MSTRTGKKYSEVTKEVEPDKNEVVSTAEKEVVLCDSGGRIGDPTQHHHYSSFKEGHFSDFIIKFNEKRYSVHRCILFAESSFFQQKFTNQWKDLTEGEISIPNKIVSDKAIEVFFYFLYTSLITSQDLKSYLFELYDLSAHFQVSKLEFVCSDNLQKHLSIETAADFLFWNRSHNDVKMKEIFAHFLVLHYRSFVKRSFPFHKVGKTVLQFLFKKLADRVDGPLSGSGFKKFNLHVSALESGIGNPSIHPHFSILKNGQYSDLVLKCDRNEYMLHKYVLFSGSIYFRTLLTSQWKESNSGEIEIPGKGISKTCFEDFLAFLYTGLIRQVDLKNNLFELFILSDYFQVSSLKGLVKTAFPRYLNTNTAKSYLLHVREMNSWDLNSIMARYIAARLSPCNVVAFHSIKLENSC
jgi:hypothetical protein